MSDHTDSDRDPGANDYDPDASDRDPDASDREASSDSNSENRSDSPDDEGDSPDGDEYVGEYDKLVRDEIPSVVREDGNRPVTRRVDGDEYERYLAAKLVEEATEYAAALGDGNAIEADDEDPLSELADVHAVLDAIVAASDHSPETIAASVREKASDRGEFVDGIVLERIDAGDD